MDEAFEDPDPPSEQLLDWFFASAAELRPKLHRFASLMCGSALDGEDILQETLAAARHNLGSLRGPADLEHWLFRMSLQRCFDFVRRDLSSRENHLRYGAPIGPRTPSPFLPLEQELVACVDALHPRERAPVILKDVLGYDWLQVATIDVSTVGHAKMALHWGPVEAARPRAAAAFRVSGKARHHASSRVCQRIQPAGSRRTDCARAG